MELPEGTMNSIPFHFFHFQTVVEKGDSIILLKVIVSGYGRSYQYRFMKSYINPDYTILQKEEIK